MKQYEMICSITTTLYPSYREGLTSPASTELVEAHLRECPHCRNLLSPAGFATHSAIDSPTCADTACAAHSAIDSATCADTASTSAAFLAEASYLKRYRRLFQAAILGVFIGVLLFALLILNMTYGANHLWKRLTKQQSVRTHSLAKYHQWEDYKGISAFSIFPPDLSGCKSVNEYYYQCDSSSIFTVLQLYLDCSYTLAEYEAEKQRLTAIAQPDMTQALFAQPACYTMLYANTACEYAIFLDEEQRIVYVSLENIARDEIIFDESYLPLDYGNFGSPPENQAKPYCQYQQ